MKRLHVRASVDDLAQSVRFYSTLFAAEPAITKTDYAKWMLAFLTSGESTVYGDRAELGAIRTASGGLAPGAAVASSGACCAPQQQAAE
jgi:catechol 2,3-dioxygenase-like lactoylglutathione lyase family enzyme